MSLRLHKEHGVNPTIPVCFFCREEKGEIVLFGASYQEEAPMRMIMDYEPCDKCREQFKAGILLIETTTIPTLTGQPSIQEGLYPTGRHWLITEDAFKRAFEGINDALMNVILIKRTCFIPPGLAGNLGFYNEQED